MIVHTPDYAICWTQLQLLQATICGIKENEAATLSCVLQLTKLAFQYDYSEIFNILVGLLEHFIQNTLLSLPDSPDAAVRAYWLDSLSTLRLLCGLRSILLQEDVQIQQQTKGDLSSILPPELDKLNRVVSSIKAGHSVKMKRVRHLILRMSLCYANNSTLAPMSHIVPMFSRTDFR
ncbi:unnamed protein product [Protopolystoma xenopodis]|uniref:Uncharacterized protein n=1 Tax=Protopolystoma xenopodis TaxID=117903 RepID=A0A448X0A2_9PLAT|nr:unnamed protein product [Protopolystoma xenopodis]